MAQNDNSTSEHFVAHLKIEKVMKNSGNPNRSIESQPQARVIEEVTSITLKGKDLDTLVDKLGKHIAIIEED